VDKHTDKQTDTSEKHPPRFATLRRWVKIVRERINVSYSTVDTQ